MGVRFNGSSYGLVGTAAQSVGWPVTYAIWGWQSAANTSNATLFGLSSSASANPLSRLTSISNLLICQTRDITGAKSSQATYITSVIPNNAWFSAIGTVTSTGQAKVYLNGQSGTSGSDPAAAAPTVNVTCAGFLRRTSDALFWNGFLGVAAIWNTSIGQGSISQLALGVDPRRIRPEALIGYWPMFGTGVEPDFNTTQLANLLVPISTYVSAPPPPVNTYINPKLLSGRTLFPAAAVISSSVTPQRTLVGVGT